MKKSLIALAALATVATAAQAQSSVTVYGVLDAGVRTQSGVKNGGTFSSPGADATTATTSNTAFESGFLATPRIGFRGSEDLGSGLKANFVLESGSSMATGANTQTSYSLFDRRAVVGVSGSAGALDLGRNTHAGFDFGAQGMTDALGLSGDAVMNPYIKSNAAASGNVKINPVISVVSNTSLGTTRSDNMIKYTSPNFSGVTIVAGYGVGGVAGDSGQKESISGGISYAGGPIRLAASGFRATDTSNRNLEYTSIGGDVTQGAFKVTASWNELKADYGYNSNGVTTAQVNNLAVASLTTQVVPYSSGTAGTQKMKVAHAGLTYQVSPVLKTVLAHYDTKWSGNGISDGSMNTDILLAVYSLSKRSDLYGAVDVTRTKDAARSASGGGTGVTAGIRHTF